MIQTSPGRKVYLLGLLRIEQISESVKENLPLTSQQSPMKSCTLPLKWPKVLGPPKWAQTQQEIPLVLDTGVTPTQNPMVEGRTPVHRKAVPVWTWDEMIRETADLYVPRDTHSPEVSVCPS